MQAPARRTVDLRDPRALRGLAHPTRLALVGLLRRLGPLTATQAGERLGQSPASCSFHLRQLAKYGLVEESGGGRGRERPWQATALFTSWPDVSDDPETAAAGTLLSAVIADRYYEQMLAWLERRPSEPKAWQEASQFGDNILYLTPRELAKLGRQVDELLEPYVGRIANHEKRPAGSRGVNFLRLVFPGPEE